MHLGLFVLGRLPKEAFFALKMECERSSRTSNMAGCQPSLQVLFAKPSSLRAVQILVPRCGCDVWWAESGCFPRVLRRKSSKSLTNWRRCCRLVGRLLFGNRFLQKTCRNLQGYATRHWYDWRMDVTFFISFWLGRFRHSIAGQRRCFNMMYSTSSWGSRLKGPKETSNQ